MKTVERLEIKVANFSPEELVESNTSTDQVTRNTSVTLCAVCVNRRLLAKWIGPKMYEYGFCWAPSTLATSCNYRIIFPLCFPHLAAVKIPSLFGMAMRERNGTTKDLLWGLGAEWQCNCCKDYTLKLFRSTRRAAFSLHSLYYKYY